MNHRVLSTTLQPCSNHRRVAITEHLLSVPLSSSSSQQQQQQRTDIFFTTIHLLTPQNAHQWELLSQGMSITPPLRKRTTANQRAMDHVSLNALRDANNVCLYLQGGPGFGSPVPVSGIGLGEKSSWIGEALGRGYTTIVLMDQRGTGRSTPITKQTLQKRFPDLFALDEIMLPMDSPNNNDNNNDIDALLQEMQTRYPMESSKVQESLTKAVEYLSFFRADNIVRDAEAIKDAILLPPEAGQENTPRPYGLSLGQSFGGFCTMTYLSQIPHPPKICLFTGGIAPMLATSPKHLYTSLWHRVHERNLRYYERYPNDRQLVQRILNRLEANRHHPPTVLPSGGILTPRRFLQLGLGLGGSPSNFASLHSLLQSAFVHYAESCGEDGDNNVDDEFSRSFLKTVDNLQPFDDAPLYFLLHESIYADGKNKVVQVQQDVDQDVANDKGGESSSLSSIITCPPTEWAAHRAFEEEINSLSTLGYSTSTTEEEEDATTTNTPYQPFFYGEVVFPWMADGDYAELSGFGMKALAHKLATKTDWGPLYDATQMRKGLSNSYIGDDHDGEVDNNSGSSRAAAAIYYDDMYVDFEECRKVIARGGPLEQCKVWITNEYQHSGLRDDGATIFGKLLGMAKGSEGTPS